MKGFWCNVGSELFTSWSPWVRWSHNRENHIYICLYWKKIFLFRTNRSISIKLDTNHPWVKGILIFSNKRPGPLQRGNNHKKYKIGVGSLKNLPQNHLARIGHIYLKAFWCNVDSSFFKPWSPGVGRGHSRENHIHLCLYRKKKIFSRTNFNQTWNKFSFGKGNFKFFK
jgi:hypothetical protein